MPIPISSVDLPSIVLERVRANRRALRERQPLPKDVVARLREQIRVAHTYHSNAIEGNTLTLEETRLILEQGVTIGGKSLREHLEATNNAQAYDWIWGKAKPGSRVDHRTIQALHEIVTRGIIDSAGRYREEQVWITGASHVPPPPGRIVPLLDNAFEELSRLRDPVLRMVYLHHRLAFVHPFLDGNGRTARLAANLVLLSAGYPPVVLRVQDRRRYYRALDEADRGRYAALGGFLLRAVDESLALYLAAVEPERSLVPLKTLARRSPYSQEYLSLRARQGVLEAVKIGDVWYSSKPALDEYAARQRRRT
jgi:Fic family protein